MGSHLVQASGWSLAATIRNVMADLEELGLIVSPHLCQAVCQRPGATACLWTPC